MKKHTFDKYLNLKVTDDIIYGIIFFNLFKTVMANAF